MNAHSLKEVLVSELGGSLEQDTVGVPVDRKISILLRFGDELLRVAKVRSVRFTDGFVNLVGETEQYFVDPDCDFLVKSEDAQKSADARPGFHNT